MTVRLSLLLALFFMLSACFNGILRINPTQTPVMKLASTPTSSAAGLAKPTSPLATPTATPTTEIDRSRENCRPLAGRVNQQPIYLATYEQRVTKLTEMLAKQGTDLNSPAGQEQVSRLRQQVFEGLVDQVIIEQQATRLGLSISASELEATLQSDIGRGKSPVELPAWLAANSLSDEELKNILQAELLTNRLFEQISAGIPETAAQVQVQYIRVADEPTARLIIEKLKQGVDFSQLAQEYSTVESGQDQAEQGWMAKGQGALPAEVEAIAFGLEPGQMNGPIPTQVGFYIIKLLNKEAERPISQSMAQSLKKQNFLDWLSAQRSIATIERFVD